MVSTSAASRRGRAGCLDAECGGGWVPIDDTYVMRQCNLTPADQPLPPFSKRTRDHLRRSRGRWTFGTVDTVAERMEMKTLYDHVRRRRQRD